jgi:hypothetical protein
MIGLALLLAVQPDPRPVDLSAFKPFLGACWRTNFTPMVQDTHCFETMYGGAHVRDRHEVQDKGKSIYAGETIYSADGPDLVFTYFNSLGGVGLGKVGTSERSLGFTGTMRPAPDKPEQDIDCEWRIIDADHYEVRSLVPSKDGKLEKPLIFTRVTKARARP